MRKERPIIFNAEMVRAILDGRKFRRKLYARKGEDSISPRHLARRLANGLDNAPAGGCWEWMRATNNAGYGTLTIRGRTHYVHRLAYELGVGPIAANGQVCHACDNPRCINPAHLFLGTRQDNMKDCASKGRHGGPPPVKRGSQNPSAKLTEEAVIIIRRYLKGGRTQQSIANEFGVSQSCVSKIKRGVVW